MKTTVEVCAGSVSDCLAAQKGNADRIELNNAVHMGGLTPSLATLIQAKKKINLPIITMVRPRGGGFCYNEIERETMFSDAKLLLENGADGLAFGFLTQDNKIDKENTEAFSNLCHAYGAEAVFHRAFDQTPDPFEAIETLIEVKVDRVLTSGQKGKAEEATALLYELNKRYQDKIEFCLGSGINENNVLEIVEETGVKQVHASFKTWQKDPTTSSEYVDYRYSDQGDYEVSDYEKVQKVVTLLNE